MPASLRRSVTKTYYYRTDVARAIEEVIFPKPEEEPVLGLLIYTDRKRCTAVSNSGVECTYMCRGKTPRIIQRYCKREHG